MIMRCTKPSLSMLFVALLAAVFLGCVSANSRSGAPVPNNRPADFALEYSWRAGSVAPASRYEYTIEIKPDGAARVTMFPDYNAAGVPEFAEAFTIEAERLDGFYRTLLADELFANQWRKSFEPPPPGAPTQRLRATAGKRHVELDGHLTAQARANRIYRSVYDVVPSAVWTRLHARRDGYRQSSKL